MERRRAETGAAGLRPPRHAGGRRRLRSACRTDCRLRQRRHALAEQPLYVQAAFALDRVKALAPAHPEWKQKQPFKAVLEGDRRGVAAAGERGLLEILAATHADNTTDEFAQVVAQWIGSATHPT